MTAQHVMEMQTNGVETSQKSRQGAMVISLDFELHWGVRDIWPLDTAERRRLLEARAMVPRILDLFSKYSIHATWATVGALFARSRDEAEAFRPTIGPGYRDENLDPFAEVIGRDEVEDPFHYAPSLIRLIANTPGQEVASHSYSHYYSLEPGQTPEAFEADLRSATAIAGNSGYALHSYVFPRNQVNPDYLPILKKYGIEVYRGAGTVEAYRAVDYAGQRRLRNRAVRMMDTMLDVHGPLTAPWPEPGLPTCLESSRYLQPCKPFLAPFTPLKVKRILGQMRAAAQQQRIFHLWWHPEDFVSGGLANLGVLEAILSAFSTLRQQFNMQSLAMCETLESTAHIDQIGAI